MSSFINPSFITPLEFESKLNTQAVAPSTTGSQLPFQNVLSDLIGETQSAMEVSQADSYNLAIGEVDNLAQVQINSLKASTMLQTTVQITTRAVNAYKEIMSMQL